MLNATGKRVGQENGKRMKRSAIRHQPKRCGVVESVIPSPHIPVPHVPVIKLESLISDRKMGGQENKKKGDALQQSGISQRGVELWSP
jgi:hypothetical protein